MKQEQFLEMSKKSIDRYYKQCYNKYNKRKGKVKNYEMCNGFNDNGSSKKNRNGRAKKN